jgi:hypothetical protein
MRSFALTLALVASGQLVLLSTPAWAQQPPPPSTDAPPAPPPPAAPAAEAPAAPAAEAPAAPAHTDGTVEVHVESTNWWMSLEHRSGPNAPWEPACEEKCDKRLPVADDYRVVGIGLSPSRPFNLDASKGDKLTLKIVVGEHRKEKVGMWILIGGGALIVAGILTIAIGSHPSQTFQADGTTNDTNFDVLTVGTTLILGGLIGGIYGGATWYNNSHSHVGGDSVGAPTAEPKDQASLIPPKPVFWGSTEQTGMRMQGSVAPIFQIPIINRSF